MADPTSQDVSEDATTVHVAHLSKKEAIKTLAGECCILADDASTNCHRHVAFVHTRGVDQKWVSHLSERLLHCHRFPFSEAPATRRAMSPWVGRGFS
jgi:hypothetical protein